jgi:hypothetical protein
MRHGEPREGACNDIVARIRWGVVGQPGRTGTLIPVIDCLTGTLVLSGGNVGCDLSRSSLLSSTMGAKAICDDVHTGWMHVYLGPQNLGGTVFGVVLHFDVERLDGYSLSLVDARYGTSWDNYSEENQVAQRDAHDAWLLATLGRSSPEPSNRGAQLRYSFPWGDAWSTFDARGGSSSIGIRFRRSTPKRKERR